MGKRKARARVIADDSPSSSKQGTPVGSDSDVSESGVTPPPKKQKTAPASAKKGPKTSEEICEMHDLVHVDLEYTDADYQNLTNYGLFVRMVRPQVQEANPNITANKMALLMEAKWREFRESNPLAKKRREEEEKKKGEEEKRKEEDRKKIEKKKKKEDEKRKKREKKEAEERKRHVEEQMDDDTEEENDDDDEEEDVESDETPKPKKGRKSLGLKIRLPLPKSAKKNKKSKMLVIDDSDDESDTFITLPRKPASSSSRMRRVRGGHVESTHTSQEELDDASDSDDDDRRRSRRKVTKKKKPDYTAGFSDDSDDSPAVKKSKKKQSKKQQQASSDDDEFQDEDGSEPESDEISDDADEEDTGRRRRKVKGGKHQSTKDPKKKPTIPGERKSERSRAGKNIGDMTDREFEKMIRLDKEEEERKKQVKKKANKKKEHEKNVKRIKSELKKEWKEKMKKREEKKEEERKRKEEKEKKKQEKEKLKAERKEKGEEAEDKEDSEAEESGENEEEEDSGHEEDDSDHLWFCNICEDGGDLLLCDGCPRSWHQECIKLETIPEGEWKCPKCTGEMPESESEEEDTGHEHFCRVCKDGGDVILCDTCVCVYHLKCLNPPLTVVPEGEWACPRCMTAKKLLKGYVQQVLTWQWSHQPKGYDELDHTHSPVKKTAAEANGDEAKKEEKNNSGNINAHKNRPERMLLVKFRDYSYWESEWITELQYELFHPTAYASWKRKWDQDEPPALEDGSSFGKKRHRPENIALEDPYDLNDRFYKWGIKPEWLQVSRIINHDKKRMYLVKWQDLAYEESTWEDASKIPKGLLNWQKHVDAYWTRRKREENPVRDKGPKPKKSQLKIKLDKQPEYIDKTGGKLHPYQLEGFNWMRFSWAQDTNIILADEMGLGKTIQAIAFINSLYQEGYSKGPFLLSVPLSTVMNWEREFEFWAPDLYVVTYVGGKDNRAVIREHEFCYKEGAFFRSNKPCKFRDGFKPKFDVLLTSYEFVSMDSTVLKSLRWSVLVIDEAHRLKSQQSLFFRVLGEYKIDYRLLLTGTPLQNNLEELFNLLNFLEKDKFDNMESFLANFSEVSKEMQVSRLHEMLAPHMLRRLKADVFKELPAKTELIIRVEMSDMQKKFYKHILTKNYSALNVRGHSAQTSLMNIMMDLRKCCNHPYLFPSAETEAPLARNGMYEGQALIKACGKLEILDKMLAKLKVQGHRVLIFSQMTRVLDILEDFLTYSNYNYERIDGSVMGKIRQEAIDRFNDPESKSFCFLLSTKAGGLGINLATADTVVIYDMDWNPHNDIQAFSRAHRIGQKNQVLIYRFVSKNTVEEKMTEVCKKKMMLTELVIHRGMGSEKAESLSKQEVNDILKFGAEKLFSEDSGKVVYTDEMIEQLLNRSQKAEEVREQNFGLNEYLRSFKVASYTVKDGAVDEEEEEEAVEEENDDVEKVPPEDESYWRRVLGSAYEEHQLQLLREQEALAMSLGKGKRTRRKVNYAEALQEKKAAMELKELKLKAKLAAQQEAEEEEEPEKEDDEDVVYMSDYEPESSESEEEEAEEEEDLTKEPSPPRVLEKKGKTKRGRPTKEVETEKKKGKEVIPPLLAKVNGQIEVLGFTGRQRRAFMDAVMRYGLPPDDLYKSQWLVRDLRRKSEKIFKAYVSLFMRHLCEPIPPNAEKFADGTPREGLSRQHVLTRIGMMSLIRKKIQEFEKINGTDSLKEFGITVIIGAAKQNVAAFTEGKKDEKDKKDENKDAKDKDSAKDKTEKDGEKIDEKDMKTEKDADSEEKKSEPEKDEDKKASKSGEKDSEGAEKKDGKDESQSEKPEVKEEKEEEKSEKSEAEEKTEVKEEKTEEVAKSEEKEEKMETDAKKEDSTDKDEKKDEKKKDEKKKDVTDSETGEKEVKKEVKDEPMDIDEAKKTDKEEDKKKEDKKDDGEDKKEKEEEKEEGSDDKKDSGDKNEKKKEGKDDKEKKDEKKGDEDKKSDEKKEEEKKDEPPLDPLQKAIQDRLKRAKELRKKFYIADGGFTDIQNLWNYEENLLKEGNEFEIWHRRHDFWLLVGIITHGYRHWQDILNDPRFEVLNRAFRSDADKMRKGAFLNRRFQLIEQALVLEEQLKRELRENSSLQKMLPQPKPDDDTLTPIDQLAEILRKLIKDGHIPAGTDPCLIKILVAIENLVGDIRQATYSGMPATIAKATPTPQRNPQARGNTPATAMQQGYPRVSNPAAQMARAIANSSQAARGASVRDMLHNKQQSGKPSKGSGSVIQID